MLEVNTVGSRNDDKVDLGIFENLLESRDNFYSWEEVPRIRLLGGSLPLEDGVESVELGESEDERDVEDAEDGREGRGRGKGRTSTGKLRRFSSLSTEPYR